MNDGVNDNGLWSRFKRFFLGQFGIGGQGRPSPSGNRRRGSSSGFTNNGYTRSHETNWDSSPQPAYASSDSSAIADLASSLERRADRYENAGDTARAAELYRAAENARESGSYEQAREYAREADHPFVNDFPAGSEALSSNSDFGQASWGDTSTGSSGDFGSGFSDNS
jgi:hypothetical protein